MTKLLFNRSLVGSGEARFPTFLSAMETSVDVFATFEEFCFSGFHHFPLGSPSIRVTKWLVACVGVSFLSGEVFTAMQDFKIIAAVGVFHVPAGKDELVCFPDGEESIPVIPALESIEGREVEAVIHYLHSDMEAPGLGSCMMGEHCNVGHTKNPTWMLHYHEKGTLTREGYAWFVAGKRVPLGQLPGHKARMLIATTEEIKIENLPHGDPFPEDEVANMVKEVSDLTDLLQGLQDVVKGNG